MGGSSGGGGGGGSSAGLEHTKFSLSGCVHVHVWAEVEAQSVLFLSQRDESPVPLISREKPTADPKSPEPEEHLPTCTNL